VYFETSLNLSESEFKIVSGGLSFACENIRRENICGAEYLLFDVNEPGAALSEGDAALLYKLSFAYAVFTVEKFGGETHLRPVSKKFAPFVDESLGVILKYPGKTNELFTRMMLNIACGAGGMKGGVRLLDPVAGKGTTLYEGLIRGFDVYGVEIADVVVDEARAFVKRFMENARYKFDYSSIKVSGENKSFKAVRHTFAVAKTKEDFKSGAVKTVEFVAGNSAYADKYYRKNFFDIIAGDLPYGVQHGNVTNRKQSSLTRNPSELLAACLPSWAAVLKPGGVMILSWNKNVLPREKMTELLTGHGLAPRDGPEYLRLAHRVDQSVMRDVVVVTKAAGRDKF